MKQIVTLDKLSLRTFSYVIQVNTGDSEPRIRFCLQSRKLYKQASVGGWEQEMGLGIFQQTQLQIKSRHIAEQLKQSVRQSRGCMGGEEKGSQQLMFGHRKSKAKVWTWWSLTELTSWGGNGFCKNNWNWAFQIWTRCQTGGASLADISVRINRTVTALTAPVNLMNTQRLRARRDREPAEKPSEHWWTDGKVRVPNVKAFWLPDLLSFLLKHQHTCHITQNVRDQDFFLDDQGESPFSRSQRTQFVVMAPSDHIDLV